MVAGDQLAIAKDTGRRLDLGDHMYPQEGPQPASKYQNLDEIILTLRRSPMPTLVLPRMLLAALRILLSRSLFLASRRPSTPSAVLAILAFAYDFAFLPFMVVIIALLDDDTIMTLPSSTSDGWDLAEIFVFAVANGLSTCVSRFLSLI